MTPLQSLTNVLVTTRPDWHPQGVAAVLAKLTDRPFPEVARAAIVFATTRPDQKTPTNIAEEGPHWHVGAGPSAAPTPIPPRTPTPVCEVCGVIYGYHEGSGHPYRDAEFTEASPDAIARARAIRLEGRE